jgi:hypothetical protein
VDVFALFYRSLYLARMRKEGEDRFYGGSLPKEDCLVLSPIGPWILMMASSCLGKVFRGLRLM